MRRVLLCATTTVALALLLLGPPAGASSVPSGVKPAYCVVSPEQEDVCADVATFVVVDPGPAEGVESVSLVAGWQTYVRDKLGYKAATTLVAEVRYWNPSLGAALPLCDVRVESIWSDQGMGTATCPAVFTGTALSFHWTVTTAWTTQAPAVASYDQGWSFPFAAVH